MVHLRVVDTPGRMLKSGTIDAAMLDAGREFQRSFTLAQLDPLWAMDLLRLPGSGREPESGHVQQAARNRVYRALLALGGHDSPAGSCAGTCWAAAGRCGNGRCARAGAAGRCGRSRRRGCWWPRWGCWRRTSA